MRKHLSLVMSNKSFVNSYRHVTLLWKAMFFKIKALLLFYLLHYFPFNNSQPNLLLLQEKRQLSIYSSTFVLKGLMIAMQRKASPVLGCTCPFLSQSKNPLLSYNKWQSLAILKLRSTFLWLFFSKTSKIFQFDFCFTEIYEPYNSSYGKCPYLAIP